MTTAPHDIPRAACFAAMFLTVIGTASITCAKDSSHYVQDGLIACWDGVENAGRGLHAASTETWTDTIGNVSFALTNVVVAEDRMFFSGISFGKLTASDTAATFANANNGTLEVVYASTNGVGSQLLIQSSTASGISLGLYNGNRLVTANSSSPTINFNSGSKTNAIAVRYSSGKAQDSFFVNGSAATKSANDYWKQSNTTTTLGALSNLTGYFKGSIYSIRLYNRRLTNEELASNYAVDLRRFLQGHPYGDDVLTVSGAPDEHGASIPPYGTAVFGLAAGDPVAVSAPAVWTNAAETVAATCVGWKLYDDDDNVVSNGVGNAFTYVHPPPSPSAALSGSGQRSTRSVPPPMPEERFRPPRSGSQMAKPLSSPRHLTLGGVLTNGQTECRRQSTHCFPHSPFQYRPRCRSSPPSETAGTSRRPATEAHPTTASPLDTRRLKRPSLRRLTATRSSWTPRRTRYPEPSR